MSLSILRAELDGCIGENLMPSNLPIEFLISWCREITKHDEGVHEQSESEELFNALNAYIEKLLLAQNVERLNFYRKNSDIFDALALELDGAVRHELVLRVIDYNIDRITLEDLFNDHFPGGLETAKPTTELTYAPQKPLTPNPLAQGNNEND
jgi:hypothetical protein